jgi:N-acetylmuramic acid 6-phosphate etherase
MTSTHLHTEPQTEETISDVVGIDTWKDPQILEVLLGGQQRAIDAVRLALPQIAVAAKVIAERVRAGGRLIYAGAGTSIRVAVQDGSELPATFGMPEDQIAYLIAGGRAAMFDTLAEAEDDIADGQKQAGICTSGDVLVAVAASGATPFTVAVAERAKARKCFVVAVVNNPGSSLERLADVGILLESGPEVISGSTRMGAGTAQKAALNLMSTLAHIKLGAVHDGLMVNVQPGNAKLMDRARHIVARISGSDPVAATAALIATDGRIKPAILMCAGAFSAQEAANLLAETGGNLRLALSRIRSQ